MLDTPARTNISEASETTAQTLGCSRGLDTGRRALEHHQHVQQPARPTARQHHQQALRRQLRRGPELEDVPHV